MDEKDSSDSGASDDDVHYVPLLKRLAASDDSLGGSYQDPIRLESPSPDNETTSTVKVQKPMLPQQAAPATEAWSQPDIALPTAPSKPSRGGARGGRQKRGGGGTGRQQKELEKQLKRAEAAARRMERPEHCQKSLHALVDRRVLEVAGGGQLLAALQDNSDVTVHVITSQQPCTVTWERDVTESGERDGELVTSSRREPEDHLVSVMEAPALAALISSQSEAGPGALTDALNQLGGQSGCKVTVLCWGLDKLCSTKTLTGSYNRADSGTSARGRGGRGRGRGGGSKIDRLQLEDALVEALLETPHSLKLVDTAADGGMYLAQMTKAIAEAPFKRQRFQQPFAWFADADSAKPVKVDNAMRGLRRLWTEQLRQLTGGSLEAAQAVATAYPSPQAMLQAFAECSSVERREKLVADLPVRRSVGPLVSSRRVGDETSKRIYRALTTSDADAEL